MAGSKPCVWKTEADSHRLICTAKQHAEWGGVTEAGIWGVSWSGALLRVVRMHMNGWHHGKGVPVPLK
jgi:hypothetical protein